VSHQKHGGGPPRRGQNPALLALQQRKRAQSHERFESDVERFYRIKRLETSTKVLDWLIVFAAYEKLLERTDLGPDLVVACLEGLLRAQRLLQQLGDERRRPSDARNPLQAELEIAQRIVSLRGGEATSHYRLGHVWLDLARPADALAAGETAVTLDAEHLPAWDLIAQCYRALGERDRGRQVYEHLLRIPVGPSTLHSRAVALLMTGNYLEGYPALNTFGTFGPPECGEPALNWRGPYINTLLAGQVPLWTGEPLPHGRLLLFFDGGFGDAFQMLRWVPTVRARVASLRLAVGRKLIGFCADQGWDVEVAPWDDYGTEYDRWLNADGLPGVCGCARPEDVPPAPYLHATHVHAQLAGTFRVGLVWAGQPGHPDDGIRSTALADWAPVLEVPGVTFYSLQLGSAAKQLAAFEHIHDLSSELTDWRDTAAVLQHLDLLITVDSAVANLAGAMGCPVWVCLYPVSDWRWLLEGSTTPWYPTARIFRQPRIGDWASVFAEVARELWQLVSPVG
jgi:hypothetical protein